MSSNTRVRWIALAFVYSLAAPAQARGAETRMDRSGLTLEVGVGAAFTFPPSDDGGRAFGLAPISLGLGCFVSPTVAVMFNATGTTFEGQMLDVDRGTVFSEHGPFRNAFYGVTLQVWLEERFFVAGGVGLAVYGPSFRPFFFDRSLELGMGLSARAGFALWHSTGHAIAVVLETNTSVIDHRSVLGTALKLEWQVL